MSRTLKLWWHCLWRSSGKHRMCSLTYTYFGTVVFCECGYLDEDGIFNRRLNEMRAAARPAEGGKEK